MLRVLDGGGGLGDAGRRYMVECTEVLRINLGFQCHETPPLEPEQVNAFVFIVYAAGYHPLISSSNSELGIPGRPHGHHVTTGECKLGKEAEEPFEPRPEVSGIGDAPSDRQLRISIREIAERVPHNSLGEGMIHDRRPRPIGN